PMRKRSPSRAPPLIGLSGSQASTAICRCSLRPCSMSLPMSELLPTPALPVKAMTRPGCAGTGKAPAMSTRSLPRATALKSCAKARRSRWRNRSSRLLSMDRLAAPAEKCHDIVQRRAGAEDAGHPHGLQLGNVRLGNDAADHDAHMLQLSVAQKLQ